MNDSTRQHCSEALSAVFIVALSAISSVALFGNSLVVITFFKNKNLRTSSNYYIVNMAASDVLCSYCNWLVYSTESMLTGRRWISHDPLASFLCKIGMYLRGTSQIVSVLSLVLIAVDRYFAIVFPLKTTIMDQERVRFTFLVLTWIIAGAFCCPGIRYTKVVQIGRDSFCRLFWNESAYTIFHSIAIVVLYFIPLAMIFFLYYRILRALRHRPISKNGLRNLRNISLRQHRQVIKMLISIVIAFFFCWTPLCIYFALKMFQRNLFLEDKCHIIVVLFFYVFPSLSTAFNPLILFLFSTNYRQALSNLRSKLFFVGNRRISQSHVTALEL